MRNSRYLLHCIGFVLILAVIAQGQEDRNRPLIPGKDFILDPFDNYGEVSWENETARLDNFAVALEQSPSLIGYIIVYAGKDACFGDAQRRGLRAKNYLVGYRHIAWDRVIWKDAGYLEEPYVMLYGQVRGQVPYPFDHPKPLPLSDVKPKVCSPAARRRNRHGKN